MEDMMSMLNEAMETANYVLDASKDWDNPIFLALIGLLVDQKAADMGRDAMSVWDDLYAAASGINKSMGAMEPRREK